MMQTEIDREKVIKGLEEFKADLKPFAGNKADWQKVDDALELLEAQEPIKPKREIKGCGSRWFCGNCGINIEPNHIYCRICGKPVKWE